MSNTTYRDAGVDIDLEAEAVQALVSALTFTREGVFGKVGGTGHFAGLIDCGAYVLAMATDGVGTKMLVADALCNWSTVGVDCIAMNVNDLYVMNLEPVAFVDYIATESLDPEKMREIGRGLNEGARQANINIVGGETATLKGLVNGLDLAGTCLGIQKRNRVIDGSSVRPGDLIIGFPSSGIHSNGLSLARKIAAGHGGYDAVLPSGTTVGEALLTPTRIYAEVLAVCDACDIHGMCHITGGGLLNFNRIGSFGYAFDDPLPVPEIFTWLAEKGNVTEEEMYRTFNMGMGYAVIVPETSVETVLSMVPGARVVGRVIEERGVWLHGRELR
ncbi:MAG: phosphoribosylformylglycinamidine cyclo-ligase [Methanocalculus sp. MSAO_Arc1]|uniref:phosphoribosylformylglycinamidine cyclo-ligase n=1 Tax=Methanocalculus TaxID=71151 RepID=UPI000FED1FFA|nr:MULTISPECIES: phosphoribosylformylglycinamidine cyclo-ligase [unclassified Methanocalculus]RQD79263.1 MAG: phosphoribosylformylglycinamidine cyclo-ligase [Methanocalculus sp. MSAO_Arc1]